MQSEPQAEVFGGSFAPVKTNANWTSMFSSVACVRPEARLRCKNTGKIDLGCSSMSSLLACLLAHLDWLRVRGARKARARDFLRVRCACMPAGGLKPLLCEFNHPAWAEQGSYLRVWQTD